MIESLMLCGIGLLAGCLLMLLFFPAVHQRAVRLTRRDLIDATPLTAKEIQAEKDQLRAQFAVSVRRLEVNMEQMRVKALERTADRQNADMARLQVELDKKNALIRTMRLRDEVRRHTVRRTIKLLAFLFARSKRPPEVLQRRAPRTSQPVWEFEREPDLPAIAALGRRAWELADFIVNGLGVTAWPGRFDFSAYAGIKSRDSFRNDVRAARYQ